MQVREPIQHESNENEGLDSVCNLPVNRIGFPIIPVNSQKSDLVLFASDLITVDRNRVYCYLVVFTSKTQVKVDLHQLMTQVEAVVDQQLREARSFKRQESTGGKTGPLPLRLPLEFP